MADNSVDNIPHLGRDEPRRRTQSPASGTDHTEIQIQREHVPVPLQREDATSAAAKANYRCRCTRDSKFVCPVRGCGRTFVRHFNLKGHMRNHYDEMEFACSWSGCEKRFFRELDCKRHEQLHLNHRPFICKGCLKPFARADALNRHLGSEGGADCVQAKEQAHTVAAAANAT